MEKKSFVDKVLEVFFDKTKFRVFCLFVFGFILRLIAARNLGVSADDVNHQLVPVNIFNSGKLVIWHQSTALWYYIQGVFYNILGHSMLASRFAAALFGSLLILLMFVFTKKVFKSERAALIAGFLVAVSPVLIKSTMSEMDVALSFFLLFGAYFLFEYFESKKNSDLVWSALLIGVGIMIKLYALFFAFSFILLIAYKEFKHEKEKSKSIKRILLFGIIIFILVIPTLAHNYLLYKDKGIMDDIFTNTLKIGTSVEKGAQYYSWGADWMAPTDYKGFFLGHQFSFSDNPTPGFLIVLGFLLKGDVLLSIIGLISLIYGFRKYKEYFWFFVVSFLPAFIYLGAHIPMVKHFIWSLVLVAPLAGKFLDEMLGRFSKIRFKHVIIVILILNMLYLGLPKDVVHSPFYGKSSFGQVADYQFPKNALIVADSRIYRGNIHWAFEGNNYIEASLFFDAVQKLNSQGAGNLQNMDVYYVECVTDDCGWGTVSSQPEFNASMEKATALFAGNAYYKEDFAGPDLDKYYLPLLMGEKKVYYRIYKTTLALNPAILSIAKQTHTWFLYPENYDRSISPIFDDYNVVGITSITINKLAWLVFYFELAFAFFAIIYIVSIFLKN